VIVVSLYGSLVILEAYVVETSKGGSIDVDDFMIRNKKELLE
jgi:hypothetical protein